MILPSEGIVDVARLSRIYDNTTATYKFYWFVSIINLISANPDRRVFSFEEIIAGMIAEAWYPIHYFRLSFRKLDSLESNILELQRLLDIPIDANKDVVRETILKNAEMPSVRRHRGYQEPRMLKSNNTRGNSSTTAHTQLLARK